MTTRDVLGIVFLGVVIISLTSCDSAELTKSPSPHEEVTPLQTSSPEFAKAQRQLDASLISNSIDQAFVRLANRFDGFGGAYENDEGQLVLVSTLPEHAEGAKTELAAELFNAVDIDDRSRDAYLNKGILVEAAVYNFTELAVYRELIHNNLPEEIPLVFTDVDERQNLVVIGLDETKNASTSDLITMVAQLGIPPKAVAFEQTPAAEAAINMSPELSLANSTLLPSITNYVRPLAGGLQIDKDGRCTLGTPVWYGNPGSQTRGFLTAAHCTGYVGINNGSQWGQQWLTSPIGTEFEDPPLTDCDASSYWCMVDVALIDLNSAHDNSSNTLPGHVYLTEFSSSTGYGGYTISGDPLPLSTRSPLMGLDVNKVGMATGWTTGEITGTCVTINVPGIRHPDGVKRTTRLPCSIRASTPVYPGDSGSSLFSIVYDPDPAGGGFLGILSACSGCSSGPNYPAYYVSWASIQEAMTQHITLFEDPGLD